MYDKIDVHMLRRLANKHTDYQSFRETYWTDQDLTDVAVEHGMRNGAEPSREIIFNPKKILFYSDTWHCPSNEWAKKTAIALLKFKDIKDLEVSGRWIKIPTWNSDLDHVLKGQATDKRERVRKV